jgi:glyceraldehyde 3-phosphate dehydrogenase
MAWTNSATRVAINGFGRIGRNILRAAMKYDAPLDFVAVNDITDNETLAHLLRYDSVHGRYPGTVDVSADGLVVDGDEIRVLAEKDPARLPWHDLGVDIVFESTGRFTTRNDAARHLDAGARKVIITAPAKNEDITIVMGVNHDRYDAGAHHVISNASCTTNCLAPVVKVLLQDFGFRRGLMTTVHSYTNDQQILDLPHKDLRRARAAAMSIIPTTTGAARATSLVLPEVKGRIDGMAMRVPTPDVSVIDLTAELERNVTVEQVNDAFRAAANGGLREILTVSDEPLVSVDYIGNAASAIVDSLSTVVIDDRLVKVMAWYDNEWAYSVRCVDLAAHIAKTLEVESARSA